MKFFIALTVIVFLNLSSACQSSGSTEISTTSTNLLVRFQPNTDSTVIHQTLGTEFIRRFASIPGLELVRVKDTEELEDIIARYRENPAVIYVEIDGRVTTQRGGFGE